MLAYPHKSHLHDKLTPKGPAQVVALIAWIKQAIADKAETSILVTHGLNISDLLADYAQQGEVLIVGIKDDQLTVLHRFFIPAE